MNVKERATLQTTRLLYARIRTLAHGILKYVLHLIYGPETDFYATPRLSINIRNIEIDSFTSGVPLPVAHGASRFDGD